GVGRGPRPRATTSTGADTRPRSNDPRPPHVGDHPGDQPWADEPLDDFWDGAQPCDVQRDSPPDDEQPCDGPRADDPPPPDGPWGDEPWDEEPPDDVPSASESRLQGREVEAERGGGQAGVVPPSWPWALPQPSWPEVRPDLPPWPSPTGGRAGLLNLAVPLATLTGHNAAPGQLSWLG